MCQPTLIFRCLTNSHISFHFHSLVRVHFFSLFDFGWLGLDWFRIQQKIRQYIKCNILKREYKTRNGFIRTCYEYKRKRKTKNSIEEEEKKTHSHIHIHIQKVKGTLKKFEYIGLSNGATKMSYFNVVVVVVVLLLLLLRLPFDTVYAVVAKLR